MHKEDSALNNLQDLICHKIQPTNHDSERYQNINYEWTVCFILYFISLSIKTNYTYMVTAHIHEKHSASNT